MLDQVWRTQPRASESQVRGVCGAFLFSGDEVDKSVGVLSGGERARVLLAQLLLDPGNLLLMDEPTNHLDVMASEALSDALSTFGGTLVFVSHNTAFVNRLATKVWDIEDGALVEYPGNLRDYLERKQQSEALKREQAGPGRRTQHGTSGPQQAARRQPPPTLRYGQRNPAAKKGPQAPGSQTAQLLRPWPPAACVTRSDSSRSGSPLWRPTRRTLEPELAKPELYEDQQLFQKTLARYTENREKLTELYGRWEHRQGELEQANKALEALSNDEASETAAASKSAGRG